MVDSNSYKPEVIEAIQTLIKNNVLEETADSVRLPRFLFNLAKARGPQFTPEDLRKLWNAHKHKDNSTQSLPMGMADKQDQRLRMVPWRTSPLGQ